MNINATLLVEIIIFIGFVILTHRYIWPPLLAIIEQRQQEIQEGIEKARQNALLLEQAQHECTQLISDAKESCRQMHVQTENLIKQQLLDAKQDAELKAQSIIADAKKHVDIERRQVQEQLATQTQQFLTSALSKILPQLDDPKYYDHMIDQALTEIQHDTER